MLLGKAFAPLLGIYFEFKNTHKKIIGNLKKSNFFINTVDRNAKQDKMDEACSFSVSILVQ